MMRERTNRYAKRFVRLILVETGIWEWAQLTAANDNPPVNEIVSPEADEVEKELEDWQDEFEQALKELEEDGSVDEPELPPINDPVPAETPVSGEGRALNMENVQSVFDELVRPALQADGGDITLIKIADNDVHVELIGACSTCPSATVTMKLGIEQMLHDEFPELGELINIAGEPQPFF